ncbi:MAG: Glyoxalase/Bleomycin resistance protein/dioxygenase domain protein [Cyanobacteria bacterium RYN_339]|nr:Glyoxalase/Bleomycin resistance protein/dioxygenase domain protein [Cyanobacteria bacterium RYN_339]
MRFDHLALPTPDPAASAAFLAAVLGGLPFRVAGPEGEFCQVDLTDGSFLLFTAGPVTEPHHVAFHAEREAFTAVVRHLEAARIPFGNDPEVPANGQWEDLHGTFGRVYFTDPAGHFFEVTAR